LALIPTAIRHSPEDAAQEINRGLDKKDLGTKNCINLIVAIFGTKSFAIKFCSPIHKATKQFIEIFADLFACINGCT
jgi:hypothetical protein